MKITKLGHCCLLLEEGSTRLLTDPGEYTSAQNNLTDLAAVLITHEHTDHLHLPSLQEIRSHNPQVRVICNQAVAALLDQEQIPYELIKNGEEVTIGDFTVSGHEEPHAEIFPSWPRVPNTGFFFNGRFFYPGDAYIEPNKPVELLAMPAAGPWVKIGEALEYALRVKPQKVMPVHDAGLVSTSTIYRISRAVLEEAGVAFLDPAEPIEI